MVAISCPGAAVAQVAYLSSDVVISVQPSLVSESDFSSHLRDLVQSKSPGVVAKQKLPEIIPVRSNVDPLLSVFDPIRSGKLTSVTTDSSVLIKSIPHLYRLAHYPVVIHVSLGPTNFPDYSEISAIRNCGFNFLHSEGIQEAQDIALTAHSLATRTGKGVIHFFDNQSSSSQDKAPVVDTRLVASALDLDAAQVFQSTTSDESTVYADHGRRATKTVIGEPSAPGTPAIPQTPASLNGAKLSLDSESRGDSSVGSSRRDSSAESVQVQSSAATTVEPVSTRRVSSDDVYAAASRAWAIIKEQTGREYRAFEYSGDPQASEALFFFGSGYSRFASEIKNATADDPYRKAGIIKARLYRPWLGGQLALALPASVKKVAVLEQIKRRTTKWGPILLDILVGYRGSGNNSPKFVGYQLGHVDASTAKQALRGIFQNLQAESPVQNLEVGKFDAVPDHPEPLQQPALENAYLKILNQLFSERLFIANQLATKDTGISQTVSSSPEYGFGSLVARQERRQRLIQDVREILKDDESLDQTVRDILAKWLENADKTAETNSIVPELLSTLEGAANDITSKLLKEQPFFFKDSQWILGSDAWAYDLGNSGVHHVLASGKNVNMLIIDSQPYSERAAKDSVRRKKDIGLYAMNFGNAYVASVAVYSSYTQVLEAMIEANQFDGPSIVMAYLPYHKENDSPVTVLQETKNAVDVGYWPLYRWDPKGDKAEDRFQLDSVRLKKDLEEFLKRDNYLTQVMGRNPIFANNLSGSYGSEVRQLQKRKAKDAYAKLLEGLFGAPMTVLFASDNGNAEGLAKRLANRGKARGLKSIAMAMDDYPLEDINSEENLILISSTAGQGEFPQNGRSFWEAVKNAVDIDLATVNFAVFGLGDSHYWPRKEDRIYYNKPAKDLHARLLALGGKALTDCGLGDDQDPDGFQTGYGEWEPKLWAALGVDNVEGLPEEPPPLTNEDIKIASNYLRGTIAEGLRDETTGAISASDQQLTKFHGTYMQDDRDLRDERKAQGLEPAYSFMIRCRLPAGVATPEQWIQMDDIATTLGNETMKLTTRQTFQFHGVVKGKLRPAMQAINKALMTTIAACGDVNRNVMCSCLPHLSNYHGKVQEAAKRISDHLLPSTTAYHEIWLQEEDGKKVQVAGDAVVDHEPLYGPTYLPRKFKITIAVPPHNDTDVYAHDIGLIAIKGSDGNLAGFNVLAGGGMGATHNNKKTYPQLGRMLGYVPAADVHIACEKIMLVQRDFGDRKNRKHARLKYTIDDMGVDAFRGKVEDLLGWKFHDPKPFKFESNVDTFGWQKDERGLNHFTMFIENGRVEDTPDFQMKTGLREIAKAHKGEFRLTGNQHLILSNVADEDLDTMKDLLHKYKLDNTNFSALRLSSSACVAFPTCGLAMAESERYLPELISKVEGAIEQAGLRQDSIVMRMTGCPNGCARPWVAEVAFVGKAYGAYNMYLGGGYHGQRLNKLYRSSIKEEEILDILRPLFKRYALERQDGERFGDWCIRDGVIKETREGRDFHDDTAEIESDEE